ncbi:hypothetical protein AQI88_03435 [Streptomyces cellostaticus]|uniref:Uncharacterized protein n=1 Tax=Streptomyces cellostaticus TaxID=67285 RepID=A0A124HDR8_9ACTN|nr:hypothetical protein AQI88_03435 [Streptomyces cellostaticus]
MTSIAPVNSARLDRVWIWPSCWSRSAPSVARQTGSTDGAQGMGHRPSPIEAAAVTARATHPLAPRRVAGSRRARAMAKARRPQPAVISPARKRNAYGLLATDSSLT